MIMYKVNDILRFDMQLNTNRRSIERQSELFPENELKLQGAV